MCDNQCLSFVGVLLGKALKTMFLENYPYPSSFHTETRRANLLSASLCSLLGLLTLFAGSYPLVKAQSEPKLGCQATVDKILQEIRSNVRD